MELDEKLAKQRGFRPITLEGWEGHYKAPKGVKVAWTVCKPHFTDSLDFCFKWVVPENAEVKIRENLIGQFTSVEVETRDGRSGMGVTRWDEESDRLRRTATSLCRALEQLMDEEQQ